MKNMTTSEIDHKVVSLLQPCPKHSPIASYHDIEGPWSWSLNRFPRWQPRIHPASNLNDAFEVLHLLGMKGFVSAYDEGRIRKTKAKVVAVGKRGPYSKVVTTDNSGGIAICLAMLDVHRQMEGDNLSPTISKQSPKDLSILSYKERIMEIRKTYPNAYNFWTDEEDKLLMTMAKDGRTVDWIASKLGRQTSAIECRLDNKKNRGMK